MTNTSIHVVRANPSNDSEGAVRRNVVDELIAARLAAEIPIGPRCMDVLERFAKGKVSVEHLHHEMRVAAVLENCLRKAPACGEQQT